MTMKGITMQTEFYVASIIAVIATVRVVTTANAVHALLYLIISLLAVAMVFYIFGAPFAAALEVIIYAGAIMVLFVFVVMMLNVGETAEGQQNALLNPWIWTGPVLLSAVLLAELVYILWQGTSAPHAVPVITPRQFGALLFGPYALAVEFASMLLLAGLVGAYHLGQRKTQPGRS